ncbi:aldehyde dehydrogenase family protein, partial [Escherichia coli]|uniref:aldehyde dehydrogenase family protein n=1 Tax=Escherichia coli TaxID=562 RepID=UPI001120DA6F
RVAQLAAQCEVLLSARDGFAPKGEGVGDGAFFAPTLLLARDAAASDAHHVEAFGPVTTLMPYGDFDEALHLATLGRGSLVGTVCTKTPALAAQA